MEKNKGLGHSYEEGEAEMKTTVSPAIFFLLYNCFPTIEIKVSVFLIHYSLNVLSMEMLR